MTMNHDDHGDDGFVPGNDPLDSLLREWHGENATRAAAQREKLMSAVATSRLREQSESGLARHNTSSPTEGGRYMLALKGEGAKASRFARFTPAIAASLAFAATLGLLFSTSGPRSEARADYIMAPDGGRLDAVNARGELIGPCPLRHTDVHVDVSGPFARVTLQQRYGNPYADKIEAVYTFPLSHRAAVDRMTMTIGDRVVVGEVKERQAARATYEAARSAGHAAALLEQERPNIFTQSVANIEPGVEIVVEISYVELLEARDGRFGFSFPMVVAPRYIPHGLPPGRSLPDGLSLREGLNLLEPGTLILTANGEAAQSHPLTAEVVQALITDAVPIEPPSEKWWIVYNGTTARPSEWHRFEAGYMDGRREAGVLYANGLGEINGRWFYIDAGEQTSPPIRPGRTAMPPGDGASSGAAGAGFASGTAQVPDAARITPQPVKPPTRAGHDISITVNIDTGGPGITDLKSELHAIQQNWGGMRSDGTPSQVAVSLNDLATIPNQDFVLHWRQTADTITEQVFTHADARGGFLTLILNPPARVENMQAVPRELVFVLDTSGSMQGFPIQKAKEVMSKAITALRPQDTFNLITFAGDTNILWDAPQPASPDKLAEAQQFLDSREGRGGTEMMNAINAALTVKPETRQLAPGEAEPVRIVCFMTDGEVGNDMQIIDAVKKNAATTRVFSFGIGNSVNRYLLDGIAKAGRGAAEYVLLSEGADEKVASFSQRIQSPVLMNVRMEFAGDIEIVDGVSNGIDASVDAGNSSSPSRPGDQAPGRRYAMQLPDLYDVSPVIVHARYTKGGKGSVTLRGNAGSGLYEKTIELDLPEAKAEHDVIATLWAREKVEQLMNRDLAAAQNGTFPDELKKQVIDLGETFQIMTQYTSFVAVENLRVTLGGQPRLVPVPIELPEGQSWEGTMGEAVNKWADEVASDEFVLGARLNRNGIPQLGDIPVGDIPALGVLYAQHAVADKLNQKTGDINWEGVSFEQAINQLRDQSGVNIVVNWDALETAAIEKDSEISLHINAGTVNLETVLKLLTEEVGGGEVELASQIGDGVIQISTKDDLSRHTTVQTYNVEDLILRMSDFPINTAPDAATLTENSSSTEKDLVVYHLKHKTAYDIGFTIEDLLRPNDGSSGPLIDEGPNEKTLIARNVSPQQREKVRKLIEMFDVPDDSSSIAEDGNSSANDFIVYHLKHKTAYDIAFTLEDMLKPKNGAGPVFDEGPNEKTLIAKNVSPQQREKARKLIEMFDVPDDSSGIAEVGNSTVDDFIVYHLKHKTAYDIAFTLEDMLKPKSGAGPLFDEGPNEKTLIAKNVSPQRREAVRKLIEMFDLPGDSSGDDSVLSLDSKNIPAEVMAQFAQEIARSGQSVTIAEASAENSDANTETTRYTVDGLSLEDSKRKQVEQLMNHATELRKERRYDDAVAVLGQTLAIDPANQRAATMKETLEDMSVHLRERASVSPPHNDPLYALVESEEGLIPWDKDVLYPKNWAEISAKRASVAEGVSPAPHTNREDAGEMVDLSQLGDPVAGARWQGFHGEPFSQDTTASSAEDRGSVILYGLKKQPYQPPVPQTRGRELNLGRPVTTTAQPAQLGEVQAGVTLNRFGLADNLASTGSTSSFTRHQPAIAAAEGRMAGDDTRLRVGYIATPTPDPAAARAEVVLRELTSTTSSALRPSIPPGLIPKAPATGHLASEQYHLGGGDVVSTVGLGVPPAPATGGVGGEVSDVNGDGLSDVPFASSDLDATTTNAVTSPTSNGLGDASLETPVTPNVDLNDRAKVLTPEVAAATERLRHWYATETPMHDPSNSVGESIATIPDTATLQAQLDKKNKEVQEFRATWSALGQGTEPHTTNDQSVRAQAEQRDKDARMAEYQKLLNDRDALRTPLDQLTWVDAGSSNHTNRSGQNVRFKDRHVDFEAAAARTDYKHTVASTAMLIDQFLVRAASLARSGRLEAALAIVDAILKGVSSPSPSEEEGWGEGAGREERDGFATARAMRDVLSSGVLTRESIIARVCELAGGAAKRLTASAERARLMAKRLDERLLRLAVGNASPDAIAGLDVIEKGVLVSVLVDAFGDGTAGALTASGLAIESTSKPARTAIGRIAPGKLADLAMCGHVRKIEAVKNR